MRSTSRRDVFGTVGLLLAGCIAVYTPLLSGCPKSSTDDHEASSDAIFAGTANDEGLASFEAASPTLDAARAPSLTAPASGAKIASGSPVTFTWTDAKSAYVPLHRPAPRFAGSSPFGVLREAQAHGTPMSGKAYLLTLTSKDAVVAKVFTTQTSWTPDDATWTKLKTAKTLEATLGSAQYDQNNIVQGSGPFLAPPVSFTIEP